MGGSIGRKAVLEGRRYWEKGSIGLVMSARAHDPNTGKYPFRVGEVQQYWAGGGIGREEFILNCVQQYPTSIMSYKFKIQTDNPIIGLPHSCLK